MQFIQNGFSEQPFKSITLILFNLVLQKESNWEVFWCQIFKELQEKFESGLSSEELSHIQNESKILDFIKNNINMTLLFHTLITICGIKLNPRAQKELFHGKNGELKFYF